MFKTDSPGPASQPRITKRRAETRLRILDAAAETFGDKGFGRTTVEDICEKAGYSRGAFYSNFDSLDQLFFALHQRRSDALITAVSAAVTSAIAEFAEAPPSIADLMDRVVAQLPVDRRTQLLNLEFTAYALRNPAVGQALAGYRADLRRTIIPILQIGMTATGGDPSTADLDDLARLVLAVHESMSAQELLEPGERLLGTLRTAALTSMISRPPMN